MAYNNVRLPIARICGRRRAFKAPCADLMAGDNGKEESAMVKIISLACQ